MSSKKISTNRFDNEAVHWDSNPTTQEFASIVNAELHKRLQFTNSMHVLDYGSGTGNIAISICFYVAHVCAMDNSLGMLAALEQKLLQNAITNVSTLRHHADTDDLPDAEFDIIVSAMTLHHIQNTKKFLDACYRALKPGGILCIIDLFAEDGSFHKEIDESIYHFGFHQSQLQRMLAIIGFDKIQFDEFYAIYKEHVAKMFPVFLMQAAKPY